jgi:ribosomal protein L14
MVSKWIVRDGNYGFRAKKPGGFVVIWCCGHKPTSRDGQIKWSPLACLHRTREEARRCPGREVVWDGESQILVDKSAQPAGR